MQETYGNSESLIHNMATGSPVNKHGEYGKIKLNCQVVSTVIQTSPILYYSLHALY